MTLRVKKIQLRDNVTAPFTKVSMFFQIQKMDRWRGAPSNQFILGSWKLDRSTVICVLSEFSSSSLIVIMTIGEPEI